MSDDEHPHLDLDVDGADSVMAAFTDAMESLQKLQQAARNVTCPGCDPTGEQVMVVRDALMERFDLSELDTLILLGQAADAREALLPILDVGCCGHDEEEDAA